MSGLPGYPNYPGGYQVTPSPGLPPGGPPAGQFLAAFQAITTALNSQTGTFSNLASALNGIAGLTPTNFTQVQISEVSAPAPPASGAIIYVDSSTHNVMIVKSNGTRITLG